MWGSGSGCTPPLGSFSLLGLDPMRTNRFVDSGCVCGLLICDRVHSAECNDPWIVELDWIVSLLLELDAIVRLDLVQESNRMLLGIGCAAARRMQWIGCAGRMQCCGCAFGIESVIFSTILEQWLFWVRGKLGWILQESCRNRVLVCTKDDPWHDAMFCGLGWNQSNCAWGIS